MISPIRTSLFPVGAIGIRMYVLISEILLGFDALDMLGVIHHIEFRESELTLLSFEGNDRDGGVICANDGKGKEKRQGEEMGERGGGSATVADHDDVIVVFAENAVILALALVTEIKKPLVEAVSDSLDIIDDLVVGEAGILFKLGVVKAFSVCDHIIDCEPGMSVFEKLGAVDGAPADLTDEIKGFYGQIVIDGDMLRSLSCSAAGGRADAGDLLMAKTLCNGFAVEMSDLGEAVFSVIGVSVSDKNDFHRELLFDLIVS